ncbi:hypothetical protein Sps_01508 [Shewanella psychrophila]|uniref:Uncharacterized protein n=1 Tax=Shewanella psychrophila TaxID=225848 RepID=A0A1S6HME3_9GAMM|nr:hypothetical protein [Shewanella psychrophila]AQS36674.1 hypothetical protein Sps_01508 [Shewanella psychrophila]
MSKYIVVDGDQVIFSPTFTPAIAIGGLKTKINGTGHAQISGKSICIDGDEKQVKLQNIKYTSGSFTTPGDCYLTIESLNYDQVANHVFSKKKVIIVGSSFTAKLTVTKPAQMPNPPNTTDPASVYMGSGTFSSTNNFVKAN